MATITRENPQKGVLIFRAFVKGREVGDVRFEDFDGEGEYRIRMIGVQKQHRRRGIGTLLMRAGMSHEKILRITLSTHKSVLPFYISLGFIITKEKILNGYDLLWRKTY